MILTRGTFCCVDHGSNRQSPNCRRLPTGPRRVCAHQLRPNDPGSPLARASVTVIILHIHTYIQRHGAFFVVNPFYFLRRVYFFVLVCSCLGPVINVNFPQQRWCIILPPLNYDHVFGGSTADHLAFHPPHPSGGKTQKNIWLRDR